jgi:hypothetical protein
LLPGADEVVFVDLDSTHRQVYGYQKQGAAVGRLKGRKTLHPLIATVSTPISRPVMVAIRLRKGKSADVRGAARFLAEALTTVRAIAPTARIIVRADSKFHTADVAATAARYGADVSLTTGSNPSVNAAIAQIRRDRVEGDPLPECLPGHLPGHRDRRTGLRRRGRRHRLHDLHFSPCHWAGDGPVDHATRQTPQPEGRCRAARTVRCPALSRRVRHRPVPDAAGRVLPS